MELLKNFGLSILASAICTASWTYILYLLRPNLAIEEVRLKNHKLNIKVVNNGNFDAVNIKVEVCTVKAGEAENITKHFYLDKEDFLILPQKKSPDASRIFKADLDNKIGEKIKEKIKEAGTNVRVRVYATHSYSGFGKAFEAIFYYDATSTNGTFIRSK
jgi:hypothetical protein